MNADRKVSEFFPSTLTEEQSNALAGRIARHFEEHGFGRWATEIKNSTPFIGFVGLSIPRFQAHFTPCVEIGWACACGVGQGLCDRRRAGGADLRIRRAEAARGRLVHDLSQHALACGDGEDRHGARSGR